jgi:hypothetical protein
VWLSAYGDGDDDGVSFGEELHGRRTESRVWNGEMS